MTVRWVLAVMLVTTLVAMHSHSPWSSLLRARNWRLPLGKALCLLLLGFPTLAKQGGKERVEVGGMEDQGKWEGREATNTSGGEKRTYTYPQPCLLLSSSRVPIALGPIGIKPSPQLLPAPGSQVEGS